MPLIPWYYVPEGDECLIITGGRAVKASKEGGEAPEFRIAKGRGVWVSPFRKARRFRFTLMDVDVVEKCPTNQGITINVQAVINFRLDRAVESLYNSVPMFLRDNGEMLEQQAQKIFAGHLRSIVGTMTIDDIIGKRQSLATEVLDASKTEMLRLGIIVESFQIQQFDDGGSDYIKFKAAPHIAAVQRDAAIAQADATRQASEAEQTAQQAIFTAQKATALLAARNKAETDQAQAIAAQAGPLQQAESEQAVAAQRAALTEKNLVTDVIRPAEAERQAVEIRAEADATRLRINTEATAAAAATQAAGQAKAKVATAAGDAEARVATATGNAKAAEQEAAATIALGDAQAKSTLAVKTAEADGTRALNEAIAIGDNVGLRKLEIEQMPAIFDKLVGLYDGAQMSFFDVDKPIQNLAGVAAQVMTMFGSIRGQMSAQEPVESEDNPNGHLAGVGVKKL